MSKILIVKTSSLGDVVHQLPAMSDVRLRFPDARLTWIVEEAYAPLAHLHPGVDEVVPVATRRWRKSLFRLSTRREFSAFRSKVRSIDPDLVIDTQGLIRSALIARMSNGVRHGYDGSSIREPIASRFYDVKHAIGRDLHAVTRNRLLTGESLGYRPHASLDYGVTRPLRNEGAPYAVLLHGTSRTAKEWDEANWIELGKRLADRGYEVVLPWGSGNERLRSRRLCEQIPQSRILDRQRLDSTALAIAGASLVIGVDTGLLHLAAAYGTPLIAIFLATEPGLTGPVGNGPIDIIGGKGGKPSFMDVVDVLDRRSAAGTSR